MNTDRELKRVERVSEPSSSPVLRSKVRFALTHSSHFPFRPRQRIAPATATATATTNNKRKIK